jgi:hypothetical protein
MVIRRSPRGTSTRFLEVYVVAESLLGVWGGSLTYLSINKGEVIVMKWLRMKSFGMPELQLNVSAEDGAKILLISI